MDATQAQPGQTPSQTVGPYFAYGLVPSQYGYGMRSLFDNRLAQPHCQGEHIRVSGQLFDGDDKPIEDGMLEVIQLDPTGAPVTSIEQARITGFRGFGRFGTGTLGQGRFEFFTVKPGATEGAPHISVVITMRGMLLHTFTRIYFDDEASANASDEVLRSVPPHREHTLIARRVVEPGGVGYQFDIHMQGPAETVFFDL
jgi:protocatechuate 3,4-dioxygenase, alpha subunit